MSSRSKPVGVRLYALALRLLPASIRRLDGDEMLDVFDQLWSESRGPARRIVLAARVFGRLLVVASLEWTDLLGITGLHKTGERGMAGWGRNLRFAIRTLRKAPAFTATTVLLIGLGVGSVTTIFTLVDHVLLRPLPYPEADRLITVENGSHSGVVFREFERLRGVEAWAAGLSNDANLTGEGDPIRVEHASVSRGFFALFGARPALGRLLVDADFEALNTVVGSHATWRSVFGEDPELVGRTIRVDGKALRVVGVLSDSFEPPQNIVTAGVDLFGPIDWQQELMTDPGFHTLQVAGRLSPGASRADVQTQLDALTVRMGQEYPDEMLNRDGEVDPKPLAGLQESTVQRVRTGLNLLLGAVGLLLLVACLNVAHLFLARGLGRVQEMAVRRALGAGPGGLIKQLLVESLVIGIAVARSDSSSREWGWTSL